MKYGRVTFRDPNGKTARFVGRLSRDGDRIHGERRDDDGPGGIILNVLVAAVADVVKIERQDPRYETWIPAPEGWL